MKNNKPQVVYTAISNIMGTTKNMTILLIEHDMKLVSGICEELTVLNFGQVLTQGKTEDVLNDPAVITAYLGE